MDTGRCNHGRLTAGVVMVRTIGDRVAIFGAATAITSVGGVTIRITLGSRHNRMNVVMTHGLDIDHLDMAFSIFVANSTGIGNSTGIDTLGANPFTVHILFCIDSHRLAVSMCSGNRRIILVGAANTIVTGITIHGTSGGNHFNLGGVDMLHRRLKSSSTYSTAIRHAEVILIEDMLCTSRLDVITTRADTVQAVLDSIRLVAFNAVQVAQCGQLLSLDVATITNVASAANFGTGCRHFIPMIVVVVHICHALRPEPHAQFLIVNELKHFTNCRIDGLHQFAIENIHRCRNINITTICILQPSRISGDRDIILRFAIATSLEHLLRGRLLRNSDLHTASSGTGNIRTTVGRVNITKRGVNIAINQNNGILDTAFNAIYTARSIVQLNVVLICLCLVDKNLAILVDPLILVIDENTLTGRQFYRCAFTDEEFRTAKQCQILLHNGCTGFNINSKVAGNTQFKCLRIYIGCAAHRNLHGNSNGRNFHITMHRHMQTASALIVILRYVATVDDKQGFAITRAHKRNRCALNTHQGNRYRHAGIHIGASVNIHRNFDILNIELRHREHTMILIRRHRGCNIAAAPVFELEIFVDRRTALNIDRTGTNNVTPCIQCSTTLYSNIAATFHTNEALRAMGVTIRSRIARLLTSNAQRTLHGKLGTVCHLQSPVSSRSYTRIRLSRTQCTIVVIRHDGFCSDHRSSRVKRNKQGLARRNGIFSSRQSTIHCQSNHLISSSICFVQIIIQINTINKEISRRSTIGIRKRCYQRHVRHSCKVIVGSLLGIQHMVFSRIPTDKLHASIRRRNQIGTRTCANLHNLVVSHSSPINCNGTQRSIYAEGNLGALRSCSIRKIAKDKFVGRIILSCCDNDRHFLARRKDARIATALRIGQALQFVNAGTSPIKRNSCS